MSSYIVLGITPDATNDEVRLAYKHKALECHPDRHINDKDVATRNFIEVNTAYRAVLRERARKAAAPQASASGKPPAKPAEQQNEPPPPKTSPASDSSARSFKSTWSSSDSTPSSTPLSSPFTTPSSSPYSSPASSPASSSTSLPDDDDSASFTKTSATCEDVDDHCSTPCSSTTNHTAKPASDIGSPPGEVPTSPKTPRAKLRKQSMKKSSASSSSTSSHEYECHDTRSKPTYTATPTKSSSNHGHSNGQTKTFSHSSKPNTKYKATELKEYYNSFPSLKDFPKVDLAAEWTYPLHLTLEEIFYGKRVCYRIKRRYLSGKTKAVVLDVDVPPGCRAGTKIVFRDAGHERRDETKQDLVFVVKEVKHERFVRGYAWGGDGHGGRKDEDKGGDRDQHGNNSGQKSRKHRKYKDDDLVMEVRLPWVDRLKEEKAKVVVLGVDGKELVFEVDCRSGQEKDGKMTGVYVVEDAGMPVRSNPGDGANNGSSTGTKKRGNLIIRWEIFFVPASPSSSKWENFKLMLKFGK